MKGHERLAFDESALIDTGSEGVNTMVAWEKMNHDSQMRISISNHICGRFIPLLVYKRSGLNMWQRLFRMSASGWIKATEHKPMDSVDSSTWSHKPLRTAASSASAFKHRQYVLHHCGVSNTNTGMVLGDGGLQWLLTSPERLVWFSSRNIFISTAYPTSTIRLCDLEYHRYMWYWRSSYLPDKVFSCSSICISRTPHAITASCQWFR